MYTMHPRHSSWVLSISYLPFASTVTMPGCDGFLIVRSQTGKGYAYAVPKAVHDTFMEAQVRGESLGSLFNRTVRGKYKSVQMPEGM